MAIRGKQKHELFFFFRFPSKGHKKASKSLESCKLLGGRKNDVIFHGVLLHKRNKFLEVDEIGRFNAPRHVGTIFQWLVSPTWVVKMDRKSRDFQGGPPDPVINGVKTYVNLINQGYRL